MMRSILPGFITEVGKIAISYMSRFVFFFFRICRIEQKRIMFTSLTGKKNMAYSCNPKYIFEHLRDTCVEEYEIIWAVAKPEEYSFLQRQNVHVVKHFSFQAFYYLMTSNVIITNGAYVSWVPFRKKQLVINTWHGGGAYKCLEMGSGYKRVMIEKRHKIAGKNTTLFLSSCHAFSRYVIRGAFQFKGPILEIGMPRNDVLIRSQCYSISAREKVKAYYDLASEIKIWLYAPTYRDMGNYKRLNTQHIIHFLENMTKERWVGLIRFHHLDHKREEADEKNSQIKDAGAYPDMQELLLAADLLITDYSSSIWDYSFLEKPCYLYVPDLEKYLETRGFYTDINDWCIPYAKDEKTLLQLLAQMNEINWHENAQKHHFNLGSYETGHATETVVNYLKNFCTDNK